MRKLLYIWILLPLCIACERDLMSYEGEEAIYFAVQSGHSYASEKDWPYMPYTVAEFGRIQEDTMVVNIKVMITGPEKDYPRPFKVVVNPDSTTAREGIDYRALVGEYTVEANRSYAYISVLFYRQPEMKNDTVTLGLKLIANDHFSLTFKEFNKMEGFTSGSVVFEQFDATMHKILVTDIMPKPSQWLDISFGTFTPEKLNRICLELGYTYEDFQDPLKMNYVEQYTVVRKFAEILNKAYENGEPILESNGQMMWVDGCVYANGTYPDK
ncbi:MAG: DUF4843 domain-containing protein [Odoribacter splanchnicus]